MAAYLKIYSKKEIDCNGFNPSSEGRFFFDYNRNEDDPEEVFPFEYFFELDDEYEGKKRELNKYHKDCQSILQWLENEIGKNNFCINNMSGIYIEVNPERTTIDQTTSESRNF